MAMKMIAVSVKDSAAGIFGPPYFAPNEALAVRGFFDEVHRAESPLCKHPEDFELYVVGVFHDEVGLLEAEIYKDDDGSSTPRPRLLARAKDLKRTVN